MTPPTTPFRRMPLVATCTAALLVVATVVPALAGDRSAEDLYRRRGYGIGGPVFGLGRGGTALAGACADLRFAEPASCGRGYGIYRNGLNYPFGF